jgi:hypothetical protein
MSYTTYFEIGGHVVESYVAENYGARPKSNPLMEFARQKKIPARLVRKADREIKEETGISPIEVWGTIGRAKRARWAFATAAAIALADGPIPIGDAIAAGLIAAYGVVEVGYAVSETVGYLTE